MHFLFRTAAAASGNFSQKFRRRLFLPMGYAMMVLSNPSLGDYHEDSECYRPEGGLHRQRRILNRAGQGLCQTGP